MTGPFKMKNSALHKGAKHGTPIHANYGTPAKKMDPMHNGEPGVQQEDFKQFSDSPADMYNSPAKSETEGEKRLAKQKVRSEKNKAFYDANKSEFSKDDSGVYRDSDNVSVSDRRRISNKEKRRKLKTN